MATVGVAPLGHAISYHSKDIDYVLGIICYIAQQNDD